jgi:hypothetical protein
LIACYDLHFRMPTYDFFLWLVHVKMLGASEVTVGGKQPYALTRDRGWPAAETERRRDSYMLPAGALAGIPVSVGEVGDRSVGSIWVHDIWRDAQVLAGGDIPRLKSALPPAHHRFTVTLREHFYKPECNSERAVWVEFAERIGARIIEDYDKERMGLHERMAIYAGAKMNFGVTNGPFSILHLTDYPMCKFCDPDVKTIRKDLARHRVPVGGRIPWMRPNQRLVWEKPTLAGLMREFERCT